MRGDGKLSVVDPASRTELVVINGLGEAPGAAAFHPSGRVLISSISDGILEVNTLTRSVTRGPGQGLKPGGDGVTGLAIDQGGRVYALDAGACTSPGVVHVRTAQLYFRETRELHTLAAFDLANLRRDLAAEVGRFAGATALAEVMLKMAPPAPLPAAYDTFTTALDALASASPEAIDVAAVRGIWLLLGVLGFEPSLVACVRDGTAIASDGQDPVPFSIADGGVACPRCTPTQPFTRLPRQAYRDLLALTDAREELPRLDAQHAAAHRRLVARFVRHHFGETGALSALDFWERRAWASTPPTPVPSAAS